MIMWYMVLVFFGLEEFFYLVVCGFIKNSTFIVRVLLGNLVGVL